MSFILDGSGISTITLSGSTSPILSADKTRNQNIVFVGTLTANVSVTFPPERRLWYITNMTVGGHSITVKTLGGVGYTVPSNTSKLLTSDGIEIVPFAPETIPVASVTGLTEFLQDSVSSMVNQDTNISSIYDDVTGNLSLNVKYDNLTVGLTADKELTVLDGSITNDKIASGIDADKVGLGNVDNTSDLNKPLSTAVTEALEDIDETKADITSPAFQGTPTTPTAPEGTNSQQIANMEALTVAINAVRQELSTSQYIHIQSVAETPWTINHNLDKYPSVTVVDLAGVRVFGEEHYTSTNQVIINFGSPFTGIAYLN